MKHICRTRKYLFVILYDKGVMNSLMCVDKDMQHTWFHWSSLFRSEKDDRKKEVVLHFLRKWHANRTRSER